jgi:ATP-binding cassette subfamily B protein
VNFIKIYWRGLKILWSQRTLASALVVAAVLASLVQLLEPVLFGRVIDALTGGRDVWHVLLVWAVIGIAGICVSVFQGIMSDRLAHRQRLTVMGEVFERAIALPYSYHSERGSGRVVRSILSGTDQLFALWLSFLREHLSSLVGIVVLVPTALSMDYRLASVLFALALIYLAANWFILKRTQGRQARVESHHQDLFGRVGDVIGNVTVVQSYTRLLDEKRALEEIMSSLLHAQFPVLTWWGLLTVITRVAATITMVCVLGVGSFLVSRGELSVGSVVAFVGFSNLLITKLDQMSSFVSRAVAQAPALTNFFELLDQEVLTQESPHAIALHDVRGEVRFDQVDFTYSDKKNGVYGLNFHVGAGKTVALVGPSGSGKSTTLTLLQRLFDPQVGRILIDGCDVRDATLLSLRQAIATVFQDTGLFNRSIAENIRVGRPTASDAEVEDAARQADAHEFIMNKPGGYSFIIGERGTALSGGERQRIAIARAIIKQAPILIFDEATSALDNESERRIQMTLTKWRTGKTTLIIAHRLSTVVNADLILVFEKGRIVESGGFDELRDRGGLFSRLLASGNLTPTEAKESTHGTGNA